MVGLGGGAPVQKFETTQLPEAPDVQAPDGANVRILLALGQGSMAHFELLPGQVSIAVTHKTVEEIWYVLSGQGEMWRQQGTDEAIVALSPGVCLTIPLGTHFQFRAASNQSLAAIAITMPPWPGEGEAVSVTGKWLPTDGIGSPT